MAKKPTTTKRLTKANNPKLSENARLASGWRNRIEAEMGRQKFTLRGLSGKADLGNSTVRHLLKVADDVSLQTLVKLADALGVSIVWLAAGASGFHESEESTPQRITLIPVCGSDNPFEAQTDQGTVPVISSKMPSDTRALCVNNTAMRVEGINAPVDPAHVILPGDVVLWAKSVPCEVGELVVANTPRGAVVRRLSLTDSGEMRLLANNAAFPQTPVKPNDLLGAVVSVYRATRR